MRDIEFVGRLRRRRRQGRPRPGRGHLGAAQQHRSRFADVPPTGVEVRRGPTLDGHRPLPAATSSRIAARRPTTSPETLRETGTDVLVYYLPVGSRGGGALVRRAGARGRLRLRQLHSGLHRLDAAWRRRFEERGLPLIGDDIKSQVGATIVHRMLANLFRERGVRLDRTYQLNFGGNTDFLNMLERERLRVEEDLEDRRGHEPARPRAAGRGRACRPERLRAVADRPQVVLHPAGRARRFGNVPLNCELKLEVWDSPNSAGVVIDAVRCAKLALDRGLGGALDRAVELLHEVPAASSSPTTRRAPGPKPSSAASS